MKKKIRNKLSAVALAGVVSLTAAAQLPHTSSFAVETTPTRYEYEDGGGNGAEYYKDNDGWQDEAADGTEFDLSGASGNGFTFLGQKGTSLSVKINVETAGLYQLNFCYCQPSDANKKVQYLNINGSNQGEVTFLFNKTWSETGTLVQLPAGESEIELAAYWGYTYFDYLSVAPADDSIANLSPTETLSNPNADANTKKLYSYLRSVYGKHVISGQQEMCGSHNYNYNADPSAGFIVDNEAEFEYLKEQTGKLPAIRGLDFLTYYAGATYQDYAAERAIEWVNDYKGIATITWHWCAPSSDGNRAFYVESANPNCTDFSITKGVTEGTPEHESIMADIAYIAEKFQLLEDAGVSVIFRPLHEAEGAWFWWGAEGPEACVKLYRLLYDQLTNVYGLDNLIWEWTSSTSPNAAAWYPGDDVVDMIGYDKYNVADGKPNPSAIASTFYGLVQSTNGQKMVAMSENDAIPSLTNLVNDKAAWLYFCPWYGYFLTGEVNNPVENLVELYQSEYCITLDELPNLKADGTEVITTTTAKPGTTATTVTTTTAGKNLFGDVDCSGVVSIADVVLLARYVSQDETAKLTTQGIRNADCTADDEISADDVTKLSRFLANLIPASELGA